MTSVERQLGEARHPPFCSNIIGIVLGMFVQKGEVSVALIDATYWEESPERREEAAPLSDVRCLLCRHSLEGYPFIAWWTGEVWGPDPQVVLGMHLQYGYSLAMGVLKDLAAEWYLDPS